MHLRRELWFAVSLLATFGGSGGIHCQLACSRAHQVRLTMHAAERASICQLAKCCEDSTEAEVQEQVLRVREQGLPASPGELLGEQWPPRGKRARILP